MSLSLFKDKRYLFLFGLFLLHIFLRFYEIETKSIFAYDQVDSAWAANRILIDHDYPLIGPANKLGSGLFVGPLYYYLISIFYYFTNLDPIAAGLFAGVTSIVGFFVLFFITKKLFSFNVALIAVFVNTVAYSAINFDRVQWEVNFIPLVSLLAFYFLYRILQGNEKSIVWLAIVLAFAFHIHLTSMVFLPLIALATLPFFPKTKKALLYILTSIPILLISLSPIIIANLQQGNFYATNAFSYANSSFHGIHLTRILQLTYSAFIQLEFFLKFRMLRFLSIAILPIFFVIYFLNVPSKKTFTMVSLVFIFFLVPWIVLSGYKHEITDYYFSTNRFVGLMVIAYLVYKILEVRNRIITLLVLAFACFYAYTGIDTFLDTRKVGLQNYRVFVKDYIEKGNVIRYEEGSPFSYFYYLYTRKN